MHSEETYKTLIEGLTDGFITLDINGCYTYVNRQIGRLIHRDPKCLLGKYIWDEYPAAVGSSFYNDFYTAIKEQRCQSNIDYYAPNDLWYEYQIYPGSNGLSVFVRDISLRKKAEDEILKNNAELRTLYVQLQNVGEQEKLKTAHQIHDELGQQLTGLKMDMNWLQKKMLNTESLVEERIRSAVLLIGETVKSVRRIVSELRPSMLDDLGLVAVLQWHGQEVEKQHGVKINFSSAVQDLKIPAEMSTHIFRIYQELLSNVIRHADATNVNNTLEFSGRSLKLRVSDNGKGMDMPVVFSDSRLGLLGVKERATFFGGSFELISELGKGTNILVIIPYFINT